MTSHPVSPPERRNEERSLCQLFCCYFPDNKNEERSPCQCCCCCFTDNNEINPLQPGSTGQQRETQPSGSHPIHEQPQPSPRSTGRQQETQPSRSQSIREQPRHDDDGEINPLQPGSTGRQRETQSSRSQPIQKQPQPSPSEFTNETNWSLKEKMKKMQRIMKRQSPKRIKVGIFSRSAENEYEWLKTRLESESFQKNIQIIRPCPITNSGFRRFWDDVSWCDFGILYHSINRGRLNITDVNDSLYDEELKYLSEGLGRKNVIVVIDDLRDSSEGHKSQILSNQKSLQILAEEIFLFSTDEKK